MRHKKMEIELDKYIIQVDENVSRELQLTIDYWTPKIDKVKKRLLHSPEKFAYEIRQCERMKELLRKQKFFGEGFQRMLNIYSLMTR